MIMDPDVERASRAFHHYLVGELQYGEKNYKGAAENFNKASGLVSKSAPELHSKLAELYLREGKIDKAFEESSRALNEAPSGVDERLLHAGILEAKKEYDQAEVIYKKLIEEQPKLPAPYLLLAGLYSNKGHNDKSSQLLEHMLSELPEEPSAHYFLARSFEIQGKTDKAAVYYRSALDLQLQNNDIATDLVRVLIKQNNIEESKSLLREILIRDPQHVEARRLLGNLMMGEGNYGEALEHLHILEDSEIDLSETRLKIALLEIERRDFEAAIRELNLLLAQHPEHTTARYYLSSIYAGQGKNKEAAEELLKIPESDALYVRSRTFAAIVLRQEGDLPGAEAAIRQAYAVDKANREVLYFLVAILYDGKKFKEAEALLSPLMSLPDVSERLLFQYAMIMHKLKKEDKSNEAMERILVLSPNNAEALNYIAYNLAELERDLERAELLIQRALKINPNEPSFIDTHGWILYKQDRHQEAATVLEKAAMLASDDPTILKHYGDALRECGRFDEAKKIYKKALEKARASKDEEERGLIKKVQRSLEKIKLMSEQGRSAK